MPSELFEASGRLVEGLFALAEGEADLLGTPTRVAVERRSGDHRDADLRDQKIGERDVVRVAEAADRMESQSRGGS